MTLSTIMNKGYRLRAWTINKSRGERRIVVKLSKTVRGIERFYVVHSPQVETILSDVEFTEPVMILEEVRK